MTASKQVTTSTDNNEQYVIKRADIEAMEGTPKQHFLNPNAKRTNKSLGDLTGLQRMGFHIIELPPGSESTEAHVHYQEEECTYVLEGSGEVLLGEERVAIEAGDFIGYRAGGKAHTMYNTSSTPLRCIVVGLRLPFDVADYPRLNKRIYRQDGQPWDLIDLAQVSHPKAGKK